MTRFVPRRFYWVRGAGRARSAVLIALYSPSYSLMRQTKAKPINLIVVFSVDTGKGAYNVNHLKDLCPRKPQRLSPPTR